MPRPSCQRILIRLPLAPRKTYRSPAWGSRCSASWICRARPFMPRRISVRPTASQTRTPEGTGIIAAPTRRARGAALAHRSRSRPGHGTCRQHQSPDRRRSRRWLRDDRIRFRRDHHGDQLRSRLDRRPTRLVAIALSPTWSLGSHSRRNAEQPLRPDEPGTNDAATISRFSASGHDRLRLPVPFVPITDFVDTSRPHNAK